MIPHSKNKTKQLGRFFNKTVDFFLDLIFPKFCFGCQKEGAYLCANCKNKPQINHFPFCPVCKNKLAFCHSRENGNPDLKCARNCKSQIKLALSPFSYDNFLIKDLIHNFKYNFVKSLGIDLAEFTVESIKHSNLLSYRANELSSFLVVPVPLHRRRLAWRGFNQSEILAKEIAEALDIKFSNALKRIKNTKPQIEMTSADERQKNIDGAFILRHSKKFLSFPLSLLSFPRTRESRPKSNLDSRVRGNDRNKYKNKTIILVDDMLTTGATLEECAKILKQNGAREIWALTVAR